MTEPVSSQPNEEQTLSQEQPPPIESETSPVPSELPEKDDLNALFEEGYQHPATREGEIVSATVSSILDNLIVVSFADREGEIPAKSFDSSTTNVGDTIEALFEREGKNGGRARLSVEKAQKIRQWERVTETCEKSSDAVEGTIVARVKGGFAVDIGLKAFLPSSQVDLRPGNDLDRFVGQRYQFQVIKFHKKRANIVVSRLDFAKKEYEESKKKILSRVKEGVILDGVIKNLTHYGAFVDLGGLDGLLHVTDMSWGRIGHPRELFQVGDEVRAKVLKFSAKGDKISLGIKQLSEDPWDNIPEFYPEGTITKGKIVSLTEYGAFVELEKGVEGLVHVSEMSWEQKVKHPSSLVSVDQVVEVQVLQIDMENKRLSLGMKQLQPNPWQLLKEKYPQGTQIKGTIRTMTNFGVFVNVEEGIDGLVHLSDMSWTVRVRHPSERFEVNQEIEVVVLQVDAERERLSLGFKQLWPDPWSRIAQDFPVGGVIPIRVLKTMKSGFLVELEPGIEGFLPFRELSEEMEKEPEKMPKEGDTVSAEVLRVNPQEQVLSLSIRSLLRNKNKSEYADYMSQMAGKEATTQLGSLLKDKLGAALKGLSIEEDPEEKKEKNSS